MKPLLDWRVAAAVLTAVAAIVYAPALDRIFAADQLWYFAEVGGESTLTAGLRHLDYGVTRVFAKGDELLFRPVTFLWLAVANWAFSYHHLWWNVANLVIHVAVAVAFFRLLIAIRPSPLALPASILFLVFEASMELVVWNHLGGYLLAWLGLCIGLRAFLLMLGRPADAGGALGRARRGDLMVFALAFTFAGLAYELMVPVAGIAALVLWARLRPTLSRRQVSLLLTPVLTFVLLYVVHTFRAPRLTFTDAEFYDDTSSLDIVVDLAWRFSRLVATWLRDLTLTTALHLGGEPGQRMWRSFEPEWNDPMLIFNGVLVLAIFALVAASISRARVRRMASLLIVLAVAVVGYPAIISLGRSQDWVAVTTYYAYPFGLLSVVVLYTVIDVDRMAAWRQPALVALVWVFAGMHAYATWNSAWEIERTNRAPAEFLTRVGAFVDAHKSEPGFSFSIEPRSEETDQTVRLSAGYPDEPALEIREPRLTEILFAPYYDAVTPVYVLSPTAEHYVRK